MTIPLRKEEVGQEDLETGGPQHVAPICVWLACEEAAGISAQIFHTGRGGVDIMQQPIVIKQFGKSTGTWSLDELDTFVPQLLEAKKANEEAAKETGKMIKI